MTVKLSRIDKARNMARFYEIDVQPTLFGEFAVWRHWGRIGTCGQSKSFWYASDDAAAEGARKIETLKRGRGYL